jgi:hypothetical protein
VNLLPPVVDAFQWERMNLLQMLESGQLAKLMRLSEMVSMTPAQPDPLEGLRNASYALLKLVPRGWVYLNMATVGSLHQGYLDSVDGQRGAVSPRQFDAAVERTQEVLGQHRPGTLLAARVFPMFSRAWQTAALNQTLANQALLACALQQHRLGRGGYPESLQALVPEFAPRIPLDVINGQELRYRPTEEGAFLLYSVGWNGADDGGLMCRSETGLSLRLKGDWVWDRLSD